jgi:opacity protein-like surface antigen
MTTRNPEEAQMNQRHTTWATSGICAIALAFSSAMLAVPNAYPEVYVGGQIGMTFFNENNKLTRIDLQDFSPAGSMSGRDLASSPVFGGKVGYYFQTVPWIGLEMEAYYTTPHIEQQSTRFSVHDGSILSGFGPVSGVDTNGLVSGDYFRVITVAPFNLMFRYHKTRFQPYVGIGPGIFLTRIKTTDVGFEGTQSSNRVGLNVKMGAEYFFTQHISGFGEVRYNYTTLSFDANDTGSFGFKAIYNPIIFSFGVGYHF